MPTAELERADIFAALETSKSLTRLVDQSPSTNIGSAPVPVYSSGPRYPGASPVIKLRFTRDASTRGYYGGGRYTVDNVVPACGSCNASKCNFEVSTWMRRKRLDERAFLTRYVEIRNELVG